MRLIKSELIDGFLNDNVTSFIYKNPTSSEIKNIIKDSEYQSIRGVIYNDGTEICWDGCIEHKDINNYTKKENINIDVDNTFRFAIDTVWIFDLHKKYTFKEGLELIVKYEDKLYNYDYLSTNIDVYYASDTDKDLINGYDMEKLKDKYKIIFNSYAIEFSKGITSIKCLLNELNNQNSDCLKMANKTKRLINAEVDGGFNVNFKTFYVYKNPTQSEINVMKKESG